MFSLCFACLNNVYLCRLTFQLNFFTDKWNWFCFYIRASTPWETNNKRVNKYFSLKCHFASGFYTLALIPIDTAVIPCVSLLCPFPQKTYLQQQWPKAQRSRFITGELLVQIRPWKIFAEKVNEQHSHSLAANY